MDKTKFDPQNPYALFSPDQWLNQFSNFNNAALPWPSSYSGTPTDAMGRPIQSFVDATNAAQQQYQQQLADYNSQKQTPGTTLNSNPGGYVNPALRAGDQASGWQALSSLTNLGGNNFGAGPGTPKGYWDPGGPGYSGNLAGGGPGTGTGGPSAAGAGGPPTPPNTWQAMLTGLANPGPVTTPGATVPASASAQPGSANLQSFLQNWRPAQSGPGSGFQNNFATALKGMGY